MTDGPLERYRTKIASGELAHDPMQELCAEKLQSLFNALRDYRPHTGATGWRARFGLTRRREEPQPPQGLYIYGEVGRGKSMLMDLFFDTVPVAEKRRVHFHDFMQDVHDRLHRFRTSKTDDDSDPIPPIAHDLAAAAWLLCFDEMQVTDITDAMILGRLFEHLFDKGVVIVTTSNRMPDDLYKNGLQRQNFLPFIDMIKQKLDVLELASPTDYRMRNLTASDVFVWPADANTPAKIDRLFATLTEGARVSADSLTVKGRKIAISAAGAGVARFTFEELCTRPLGPGDYIALATHFHTIVIDLIPKMPDSRRDWAKRFGTLIDAMYEHKTKLVCAMETPPGDLYTDGDYAFEFQRTVSRLTEMRSQEYLDLTHLT
ncbi:cell division protein ZapE [Thalassospira sp.]|uniref:cell division protein ZapE n=1 Tax=Thalassospira sp. TaxID=1912094 RepID=UPI0027338FE2|nr:cell division protein ZapE [Thalassospira sp.]MDP2699476.1 cell division protein ZapE [Thalassospira sp.]